MRAAYNRTRILDLRDSPWVDGPGRTILDTARMVDQERYEIIIGSFCRDAPSKHKYLQKALEYGLKTAPILETRRFEMNVVRQILAVMEKHSIDILHTHDFRSNVYGLLCAKISGKPIVSTSHGWIANSAKDRLYVFVDRVLLRLFNRIITVSEDMKRKLLKMGFKNERLEVVRNALIIENYKADRSSQVLRDELGIDKSEVIIGNIGRLSPEKGQDIFLLSASDVIRNHENARFLLVGKGGEEKALQKLAYELGIAEHIQFLGYRDDMHEVYNNMDLVVQSSYTEGMPNVILESLLMEVPVVATRVGGTGEIVEDGVTGILIDAHSREQLTDGILGFMSDPEFHMRLAREGRQYVTEHFDHKARICRISEIYDDLAVSRESR